MIQTKYWSYYPTFIPDYVFDPLYEVVKDYCVEGINKNRISCVYSNKVDVDYWKLPVYKWEDGPSVLGEIRKLVEQRTQEKYDYVLVHIYKSGKAGIGYHRDDEATRSSVVSISLGATRKFRFRLLHQTQGWEDELHLKNGDMVWMHGPNITGDLSCQEVYSHSVPVESKVKKARINLTFRQYHYNTSEIV